MSTETMQINRVYIIKEGEFIPWAITLSFGLECRHTVALYN